MPRDRYLKIILTVIAIELGWLSVKDVAVPVSAQQTQQNQQQAGQLDHLAGIRMQVHFDRAQGLAAAIGIVLVFVRAPCSHQVGGPTLKGQPAGDVHRDISKLRIDGSSSCNRRKCSSRAGLP